MECVTGTDEGREMNREAARPESDERETQNGWSWWHVAMGLTLKEEA